jgi:hypothetical protein
LSRNPNNQAAHMQLDMLKSSIDARFGLTADMSFVSPNLGQANSFWNEKLNSVLGVSAQGIDMGLPDGFNYANGNNRWLRTYNDTMAYTLNQIQQAQVPLNAASAPLANTSAVPSTGTIANTNGATPPTTGSLVPRVPVN